MTAAARLFDLGPAVHCPGCPFLTACGAARTESACAEKYGLPEHGGEHAMHPRVRKTHELMALVDGPSLDAIASTAVLVPELGNYVPQIRNRAEFRGFLHDRVYAVRLGAVLRARGIRTADSLRELAGLNSTQKVVLLLFAEDEALERLWLRRAELIPSIASARYDAVVAPSYSAWLGRPRPDFLFNTKRSFWFYGELLNAGVQAIPRLTWLVEHDVRRIALWLNRNSQVQWVALDWMTYKRELPEEQLAGLRLLDRLTQERLRFLVNGPTTARRCAQVFLAVEPDRVCITNATWAEPPSRAIRQLGPVTAAVRGSEFRRRARERRESVINATRMVESGPLAQAAA